MKARFIYQMAIRNKTAVVKKTISEDQNKTELQQITILLSPEVAIQEGGWKICRSGQK